MGYLEGKHEISVIGRCYSVATSASAAKKTLCANPNKSGPKTFEITVTKAAHVRMGPAEGFAVTTDDFRLAADAYLKVTVTKAAHNTLHFIQASEAGTIYIVELDNETPGTTASGSSTDFDD